MCLNTIPPVSVVGVCIYQMVPPLLIKAHYRLVVLIETDNPVSTSVHANMSAAVQVLLFQHSVIKKKSANSLPSNPSLQFLT